ncbi:MAG: cob(I)yrinic acid a,c-diamide adenosyltransferase [Candidatus Eremiobacteraeota bacterium]|nr:cob(I)yrinic acid a,c-diamide adenosyltransferase [Candidatus Eremiobacteraeota bacterium]
MAKRTRIYTRAGDTGQTGLVGGQRVAKDSLRISSFGDIDECSSAIGLARSALRDAARENPRLAALDAWLAWTQDMLFNLGSDLATLPADKRESIPRVRQADIDALEGAIDEAQDGLPALDAFIHPGGALSGAFLHLARAVCRRAERTIALLARSEPVDVLVLAYVNRLSDALFAWARYVNYESGEGEHRWNPASKPPGAGGS